MKHDGNVQSAQMHKERMQMQKNICKDAKGKKRKCIWKNAEVIYMLEMQTAENTFQSKNKKGGKSV